MNPSRDDYLSALLIEGPPAARCELVRALPSDDFGPRVLAKLRSDDQPLLVRGIAIADAAWVRASRRIQALAQVQDEHASTLMAYGRHEGLAYFVHAFEPGPRLTALLKRRGGRLRLPTLLPLFGQVLLAVSDAHRRGVVVGGVRPQDLRLVEADGTALVVRLRDFGLAAVLGTPAGRSGATDHPAVYRAPEPDVSQYPSSDVFSLGVLFIRLLTGPLPILGDDTARVALLRERLAQARDEVDLPDGIATLMSEAVDLDPGLRPCSAVQMLDTMLERIPAASLRLTEAESTEPWAPPAPPVADNTHWPARQWTVLDAWEKTGRSPSATDSTSASSAATSSASTSSAATLSRDPLLDSAVDLAPDGSKPPIITGHTVAVPPVAVSTRHRLRNLALGVGLAAVAGLAVMVSGDDAPPVEASLAAASPPTQELMPAPVVPQHGTLIVDTSPPGIITVDGVAMGSTPHRGPLNPGLHVVRVQAEGHQAWRSRVELVAGEAHRVNVKLEPEPAAPRMPVPAAIAVRHR